MIFNRIITIIITFLFTLTIYFEYKYMKNECDFRENTVKIVKYEECEKVLIDKLNEELAKDEDFYHENNVTFTDSIGVYNGVF